MPDAPKNPTSDPNEQPPAPTQRDLQRDALRDLVALSTECSAEEERIEREHQTSVANNEKEFEKTKWAIDERVKKQTENAHQQHTARTAEIKAKFESDVSAAKANDKTQRQRIEQDLRSVERDVKKNFDQAVWLAESVFDATQVQIREELKKAKDESTARIEALDERENKVSGLLATYGMTQPPPVEETQLQPITEKADEEFVRQRDQSDRHNAAMEHLFLPKLFVGGRFVVIAIAVCALVGAATWFLGGGGAPQVQPLAIAVGAAAVVMTVIGIILKSMGNKQVIAAYTPLRHTLDAARHASQQHLNNTNTRLADDYKKSEEKRKNEEVAAKEKYSPVLTQAQKRREHSLATVAAELSRQLSHVEHLRDADQNVADELLKRNLSDLEIKRDQDQLAAQTRYEKQTADIQQRYEQSKAQLQQRWSEGLKRIQAPLSDDNIAAGQAPLDWESPQWNNWNPPRRFVQRIRFGEFQVDLKTITDKLPKQLPLPPVFSVPAFLAFPRQSSLLIHTDRAGRADALFALQMIMMRLLTFLPAGRVRFVIMDPVGLGQNFAGFMHLADYDEALVGAKIWTDADQIDQRLADLTEHMETVIQKYLRNEFATIDDYNAQAGELAEPYRFLVISDFPTNFTPDSFRRLASIASTGSRCGVYTLVLRDTRIPMPAGTHLDELQAHSVNLVREKDRFVWKDEVFKQFPLTIDPTPSEEFMTRTLQIVGQHAKDSKRVEVPFDSIAPSDAKFWSGRSNADIAVPIGRMGATRLQYLKLGKGVAQHVLIAGKTGSGKSTLLHALITNLAMWYSPDEVEFYLIDFKKGVEFKTYASHNLPHARAIAVESDREFGLSVLQRIDAELARRGAIFRKLGVQDLNAYREVGDKPMPRTLLIIDEFQEFFSEDDKLAQDAALLLDRLVRQGRAFGIHVLLGSQTIGGSSGLARSTIGQMAVRIALQCSEADSQLILGDNNSAARLLSRPGEAIYNDAGGLVESNSPFQIAWLNDDRKEQYLDNIVNRLEAKHYHIPAIVFEGNAPADITKNHLLARLLDNGEAKPSVPVAWVGDPVAIKDPTGVAFRRQSGTNMLIIGQQEEGALAMLVAAMLSLAAHHTPQGATFYVLDGSPADSPLNKVLSSLRNVIPQEMKMIEFRGVAEALNEIAEELSRRQAEELPDAPSIYIIIYGLQRYRVLRKQEDSFSFGGDEDKEKPKTDKQFAEILREGPPVGIHILSWIDTATNIDRTLDRNGLREFDHRILFQMSANDSSTLIDSPLGNKLGYNRALAYSEEQGTLEKFRPYGLPPKEFLERIAAGLGAKVG